MKRYILILLGVGLLAVAVAALGPLAHHRRGKPIASLHGFSLTEPTKFLTEDLALDYARQALVRDGLDTNAWLPVRDRRLAAWAGKTYGLTARNPNNSNHVCIGFRGSNTPTRFVSVYLIEGTIHCQSSVEE